MNLEEMHKEKFIEKIRINGKEYEYIMTSSSEVLKSELQNLGCRLPVYTDYRYNPQLSLEVRDKMILHQTKWSFTFSNGSAVLNYYKEDENGKGTPYIVFLSELLDFAKLQTNYSARLLQMFEKIGHKDLPGIASEWSPLMVAVSQRKTGIVKFLLENGISPDCSDSNDFTPLMLASFLNETEIMSFLIKFGADVNARSKNNFTALIYAIYANALDAVKILNENGADLKLSITPKIIETKRTFKETLEFYISNYSLNGIADVSLIYKNCGMSKQNFSKIRSSKNKNYHPHKETVIQLAIGMRLTLAQTETLLSSAGFIFEEGNPVDRIVKQHISNQDYDIDKINDEIWKATGKSLIKDYK